MQEKDEEPDLDEYRTRKDRYVLQDARFKQAMINSPEWRARVLERLHSQ